MVSSFSQEYSLAFSAAIADPEMRALLLIKVIHHDLMLDVVNERAPSAPR